mmetsp:Transcript_22485/g.57300  ORF Transcript_22485/g.57300 Transcript_22485/m.57300 type:complete len:778 (-) Transcript_22485:299-2632(-)
MAAAVAERDEFEANVRMFSEFLHSNRDEWEKKIDTELANGRTRIPVDLRDLAKAEAGLDQRVLRQPVKYLLAWEEAVLSFLGEINDKAMKQLKQPLRIDIGGSFGRNFVTPRGVNAGTLHKLMCIEGLVTKAGTVNPKLVQSMHVHKHKDEGHVEQRDHRDATSFVNRNGGGGMPQKDQDGNELMFEIGMSVYKDMQRFTLQETPENTPPGQIPRSIEVICDGDLAERVKPGDRAQVVGVYRPFPLPAQDFTNGVWPARLVATNIQPLTQLLEQPFVSSDVRNIKDIAAREDTFDLLARSFAPSICGHERVKAGMLLQMIGGTEKNLPNGTHLRGDINVLLVGDPSCGKSQMLRFVMNLSPGAVSTTGRGSSGVGLTAAMIREPGSKDFTLEAGAMVLADRNFICIDEFDKMSLADRVAIHEAMEQQCVTINKAGMHVSLNSRCGVVAAANPIYGSFDPSMTLAKNIGLPDSLLSRFDLVFVVRDMTTEEIDRRIATQVLRQASNRGESGSRQGVEQVHSSILERRQELDSRRHHDATEVFERGVPRGHNVDEEPPQVITLDFMRKYLRYCKRLTPVLSPEAQAEVAERYVDLRLRFQSGRAEGETTQKPRLAVTTRTLEALIRLATAHAKLKLRKDEVLVEDVKEAYNLMLLAREEEVPSDPPLPPPAGAPEGGDDDNMGGGDGPDGGRGQKRPREGEEPAISKQRFGVLRTLVSRAFARSPGSDIPRDQLMEAVNAALVQGEQPFVEDEFDAGLGQLEDKNKIMIDETGMVTNIS